MSIKDNGGSAFPRPASIDPEFDARLPSQTGMTLRDYFAAKAMQVILGGVIAKTENEATKVPELASEVAYLVADAMLTERAK